MVAHLVRCAQTDKENKGVSVSADVNHWIKEETPWPCARF